MTMTKEYNKLDKTFNITPEVVEEETTIVERAQDNTTAASHVKGTSVRVVNPTVADNTVAQDDNALIEEGDDFGFDGVIS